jgi:regulator of RNase E activity RraA
MHTARFVLALALAGPLTAQIGGFDKAQLAKYTRQNPFERFDDGRPKVPQHLIDALAQASSEMLWGPLRQAGYHHQWSGGWQIVHPEKKLIGRAVTAVFMPVRPDVDAIIKEDAAARNQTPNNSQRVIDSLRPGDVLVVDLFGKIDGGAFAGDNLATAIHAATGQGFVIDGSIRDLDGVHPLDIPVYVRGFHVSPIRDVMLTGINVPVRIGTTTVMPGDLVVGDREGLTFVPPSLVESAVRQAKLTELHDIWTKGKLATGRYKASELYPSPGDEALKKEYEEWLAEQMRSLGLE